MTDNQLINPALLFEKAQLQPAMHVADLGCGRTGHIVFPASLVIGERGVVYAVDIIKDILDSINKKAKTENLINIKTTWADLEKVGYTAIPESSLDVGFVINTLFQSKHPHDFLSECIRLLKAKARLLIVDWERNNLPIGPGMTGSFVDFNDIKSWILAKGLYLQEEFEAGKYHRGLVFYKHD